MPFNTATYIFLFLPLVIIIYFMLTSRHLVAAGKMWLIFVSLLFFCYNSYLYLPLIFSSLFVNFLIGNLVSRLSSNGQADHNKTKPKILLTTGIIFNICLLGYFKYADFFIENFNAISNSVYSLLKLALPLAISFYTFQQIAFLVDCYLMKTEEKNFLNYCFFVMFFPQLIAGPIVRHQEMMPQFHNLLNKTLNWSNIAMGIFIFSLGLFKKVVVAETFALWANAGFDSNMTLGFFESWATSLSYTFQLYYDFSGYTDMAIGSALMFNIRLPINFNSPYKALSIQDFWHRWHITLSRWLRDYLYIPLGGNRKGTVRTLINILITFLLAGIWHGAGWTFMIWGFMHGIALAAHRIWKTSGLKLSPLFGWFVTFIFVNAAWVVFRASTFESAIRVLKGMVGMNHIDVSFSFFLPQYLFQIPINLNLSIAVFMIRALFIMAFMIIALFLPNSMQMTRFVSYQEKLQFRSNLKTAVLTGAIAGFALITILISKGSDFLYFNF